MLAVLAFLAAASMGADSDARDVAMSVVVEAGGDSVTLDAPAYTRTVTASSYTLTGTSTGSGAVTWAASPSGSSGACTGTDSFSCVVTVTPDATGEGVETITVTRGAASDTETLGFYVAGAHSAFLSQNINGSYNAGLANLDAVATWENVGTSALDVTQGTGAAQPTFRTGIVGGQPVVRCDGGDNLTAASAANWVFLTESADWTESVVWATTAANPNALFVITTTQNIVNATTQVGGALRYDDRSGLGSDRYSTTGANGASSIWNIAGTDGTFLPIAFGDMALVHDDDGGAGADFFAFANNVNAGTHANVNAYTSSNPASALRLCQNTTAAFYTTGDLFRVLIYQSALSSTQRGINKAVDEWALGGTLPVTP